ncbi:hypothetical protein [Glacieibacterium frigidum]|uniref:Uncharacterized protein n=1 Tax=Glacieibacterium frigidum TaxID=2593303 RepID=A0A552U7U0_9SPHN|nr:hypothetical protein [Glacieibacterium frigidum]TRW14239.1 hypothetical protein FMM06_11005 [Glacieibacterium frigidum]
MTDAFSNDNGTPRAANDAREPDAYGQAALFLVESVLHGLIERSVFSIEEAIQLVDIAVEVKSDLAGDLGDSPETLAKSLALLSSISSSLRNDLKTR